MTFGLMAKFHYAECIRLSAVVMSVIMLYVTYKPFVLSVVMLIAIG